MNTTFDHVPSGTTEIRRDSEVITIDHHVVGHVDGFVTNHEGAITHLVLHRGHLWGQREVAIPLADITAAGRDAVKLNISRETVRGYPEIAVKRR